MTTTQPDNQTTEKVLTIENMLNNAYKKIDYYEKTRVRMIIFIWITWIIFIIILLSFLIRT